VLLRLLRDLCARDLAALGATCRRFSTPALDCASVAEAAARLRCLLAGWPQRRVCATWVCALRLTECELTLPSGSRDIGRGRSLVKESARVPKLKQAEPAEGHVPPSPGARCAACGLRGNSWLNLTSGTVLCGRRQFDGSGANACALKHAGAEATRGSPAPLAVKLGTVSADLRAGELRADVFSYPARDAVRDPRLAQHLAHWGIDASSWALPKSESVAELVADYNVSFKAAIASWFGRPADELLSTLNEAQVNNLKGEFAQASRLAYAAQRAAAARLAAATPPGEEPPPMPPLPPLQVPLALLHGQAPNVAALAAQMAALAAEEAEYEVWDAAEAAASAVADSSSSSDDDD
jgi:hypothetical protein